MSLAQLKEEAARLQDGEQRALIAYLVALRMRKDEEFQSLLTQKVDETDPSKWVDLDAIRGGNADF